MQGCQNDYGKLVGRVAVLRMAFGCPETPPLAADWKRMGALTTKGLDYSMNTISSDADDSKGLVENLVTNMDLTISGEGEWRKRAKATEIGPVNMSKYLFTEVQAGRQPGLWVRFDFLGVDDGTYIQGYFNTTSWSSDFGSSDFATYSGEWKVADADSVTFVDGSAIPVASVTVAPATSTGAVATTVQLTATVLPADATDKTGVWTSYDATKATVNSTGLVTRVAVGTATITFTTNDGAKTASSNITITA
ncbi:Ig-like domain-containing protein [Yersinia intermedia]|uniref:Ig-like domain-containing protein n=1 Tax=Yersinia intermedia TaxID=631 RepID=UPI000B69F320|nr:Ig-like domain-containing protein [Yersinia intermedia]MCW8110169.1 Ig-like domain-containing protein [Yersinia intermedia]MDA5515112.1 Ig-like domain-containing protein [Yersinia intermedia]OWF90454.1 DNA breaking-rejoining protein [Yersinia intermedia]